MLLIDILKKTLKYIFDIYYLIFFQKNNYNIEFLINFDSKINIITLIYTKKLDFQILKIDIRA